MKVLNLQCAQNHYFEGWFGSEEDFQAQCASLLVVCPFCGDTHITKLPSAPRLNLKASKQTQPKETSSEQPSTQPLKSDTINTQSSDEQPIHEVLQKVIEHVLKNTEDVGDRFAEEARRIHYGETTARAIRGQTTLEQAQELQEEGVDIMALPLSPALKGTIQ